MSTVMDETTTAPGSFFADIPSDGTATTIEVRWPAEWLKRKVRALQDLRLLSANWDSYGAYPVDLGAIGRAIQLLEQVARITSEEPSVSASPSGTPLVSWTYSGGNRVLELEFLADGTICYALTNFEDSRADVERQTTSMRDFVEMIPGA